MDRATIENARQRQDWPGAEAAARQVLDANPCDHEAWYLLADVLSRVGDYRGSLNAAVRSLSLNQTQYPAWCLMANAHAAFGDWGACLDAAERALAIAPGHPGAHWLRSHALMAAGNWREAWASYEYGELAGRRQPRCIGRKWEGEPMPGQTLFIWGEQGHGDQIQCARFLRLAKERSGANVVLECRPSLLRLLGGFADTVIATQPDKSMAIGYDAHASLMSLPHVLGLDGVEGAPYLSATPRQDLRGKVGLCWKGFGGHPNDANRSMPDAFTERFRGVSNVVAVAPVATVPEWMETVGHLADFKATADALAGLDRLISVDTATAHVAGALGIPTDVFAPLAHTEPRWGTSSETPWYDSWTIHHEPDWDAVADKMLALAG